MDPSRPALLILALVISLFVSAPVALVAFPRQSTGAILITGTSTGIGRSAAIGLCARGFTVVATLRRPSAHDVQAFKHEGVSRGCLASNLHIISADVTNATERTQAMDALKALNMRVAAVINNAGVSMDLPFEFVGEDAFRNVMEVNFIAPMLLIREAIPWIKRDRGRVVTVGSIAGRLAAPGQAMYAASKHALEGAHDALRRELLEFGVSVSMVDPGCVKSGIFKKSILAGDPSAQLTRDKYAMYARHFKHRDWVLGLCERFAAEPDESSTVSIVHAVTDEYPKARYWPGTYTVLSGRMLVWLNWALPERILDLATAQQWPGVFTG